MALKDLNILVVDDDQDVLTAMRLLLKSKVKKVVIEKNQNNLISLIKEGDFDIIILDMNFDGLIHTGNEGIFWLKEIKKIRPAIGVILITAYGDIELAIRSLKEGASNFLVKPWKNDKLIEAITEVEQSQRTLNKQNRGSGANAIFNGISNTQLIGESAAMQEVFFKIKKLAPTDANILVLGENGTGKDLIARAIHDHSLRAKNPFVKVDVGSLTPTLFESELFGYKKGAFTDATQDRRGRFELADSGTLFLDEIGNIMLRQQSKLLSVLQNRIVTPLGSNENISIDIRLICATNLNIQSLSDEEKFRKDLIYRINTVEIIVPPLRDREGDIKLLSNHFLKVYAEKYFKPDLSISEGFLNKLEEYSFPGNVRELQYIMEKSVIMTEGNEILAKDLVFSPIEKEKQNDEIKSLNLDAVEKNTIIKVLEKNKGNVTHSAKELGITRTALYRRMEKHGI